VNVVDVGTDVTAYIPEYPVMFESMIGSPTISPWGIDVVRVAVVPFPTTPVTVPEKSV
jgi:hypothetical protein